MIIALDYDKTYTADPKLWDKFCTDAVELGHKIICLTMRYNNKEEKISNLPVSEIYYTSRKAKLIWAKANNIHVDIWIDDKPSWLFDDAASAV